MFRRHLPFLRAVFWYALTAFGGPQGHMGMMVNIFAVKRKDVTEAELIEYNSFCQLLPGPSSTQTIILIALKRGGIPLSLIALLLWILPATVIMGSFSFLYFYLDKKAFHNNIFTFIQPMSVGFIAYAAVRMMRISVRHLATWLIMLGALLSTLFLKTPWVFPIILILAGTISNFSNKRIPDVKIKPKPIQWINLWIFAVIFIVAGLLSETARLHHWEHRRIFNLFENFFRFGTIVFGGGQALLPMILYQFVDLPKANGGTELITSMQLLTGYGMVQAVPGPVFSMCSFVGGMVMNGTSWFWQVIGCLVATIGVFLPSTLLLYFFFPIYQNMKNYVVIFRALEGIHAAVIGFIWASGIILYQTIHQNLALKDWISLSVIICTFLALQFSKIPAPIIVLFWLLFGFWFV